jgi:AraC-like DNA-binding protein
MIRTSDTDIYISPIYLYAERLNSGETILHRVMETGWILDFSLDGAVEINGIELSPAMWKLSFVEKSDRIIKRLVESQSGFLSLSLHENPYMEFIFRRGEYESGFTNLMIYPLLKIISILKDEIHESDKDIWLKCYIQLLLSQLNTPNSVKCTFRFDELSRVFQAVTALNYRIEKFPSPAEIVMETGMNKSRFQKACLAIFDQSVRKIIQHLKMNQAFKAIIIERKEINDTSASLGYRHSPNFITAFHSHFSLTPMEAVRYNAG